MKYKIVLKNLGDSRKFLTIQFELDKNEYNTFKKNFPEVTFSQLDPKQWKESFFKKCYTQSLISNYPNHDINPRQLNEELSILKEAGVLQEKLHKEILANYIQQYYQKNPQMNWPQNLSYFGAAFS